LEKWTTYVVGDGIVSRRRGPNVSFVFVPF